MFLLTFLQFYITQCYTLEVRRQTECRTKPNKESALARMRFQICITDCAGEKRQIDKQNYRHIIHKITPLCVI